MQKKHIYYQSLSASVKVPDRIGFDFGNVFRVKSAGLENFFRLLSAEKNKQIVTKT